jgi:RNA polymerase sigma-70 factor (ECF subfamily)
MGVAVPPAVEPGVPDDPTSRLAKAARSGDPDRFAALYHRTAPAVFAWLRLRIPPEIRPRLDAEDVLQEVTGHVYLSFARYDPAAGPFRAWLFGIARNVLRQALASLGAGRARRVVPDPALLAQVPDEATSIGTEIARDETVERLIAEIDALTAEERRLVILRGLEGLPHGEVAANLGIAVNAAEKRWQRLREKLARSDLARELLAE